MNLRGLIRAAMACAVAGGVTAGALMASANTARADYGPGAVYQVTISANAPTGSFWVWAALYDNNGVQTTNYQETDCIHLPHIATGALHDGGDGTWSISGGTLYLYDVNILANAATATIAVPLPANGATYGHTSGLTVTVTSEVPGGPPLPPQFVYPSDAHSQNQISP
jgi:hypothetical protein